MSVHVVAGRRLKLALENAAEDAGCTCDFAAEQSRAFSSASFVGGRHKFDAVVPAHGRPWVEQLDEHAVRVPGFVLMQLEVGCVFAHGDDLLVALEALTVKEA